MLFFNNETSYADYYQSKLVVRYQNSVLNNGEIRRTKILSWGM